MAQPMLSPYVLDGPPPALYFKTARTLTLPVEVRPIRA
jgi:hypothetical protein